MSLHSSLSTATSPVLAFEGSARLVPICLIVRNVDSPPAATLHSSRLIALTARARVRRGRVRGFRRGMLRPGLVELLAHLRSLGATVVRC
jgi:hypothetical protein